MSRNKHCSTKKTIHHCIHLTVSDEATAINNSTLSREIAVINLKYLRTCVHPISVCSLFNWVKCNLSICIFLTTEFPRLDALHVLDASARFNAGCSGRQTF